MKRKNPIPDFINQKLLKECYSIREEDGALIWNVRPDSHFKTPSLASYINNRHAGKESGHTTGSGYLKSFVYGVGILNHWIIWMMVTGKWPIDQIDHKNGIKKDNRFDNLREASNGQNACNKFYGDNTSGYKGVSFHKGQQKFNARIMKDGKMFNLGAYDDPKIAAKAYNKAAIELHGEFALINNIEEDSHD